MATESDPRTRARDRVLLQLKTKGPQQAADLARMLEITPMAVRQHLAALEQEALVRHSDRRGGVGRPARIWELTPEANQRFPDSHAELTVDLLEVMRETLGEEGLGRLISARTKRHLDSYREKLPGSDAPVEARVAALTQLRCDEGYMAEWSQEAEGSWLIVENPLPDLRGCRDLPGPVPRRAGPLPQRTGRRPAGRSNRALALGRATLCLSRECAGLRMTPSIRRAV